MLNYTSLFSDLEARFRAAGRDPGSYRRMAAEVARAGDDLRDYLREVTTDYVARLERRLSQPGPRLSREERDLLRGFLGHPPEDPERDRALVDDLGRLEESVTTLRPLRDVPLNLRNLEALRRVLARMEAVLPRIVEALEARERVRRFEEATQEPQGAPDERGGGEVPDREWLLGEVRRALRGSTLRGDAAAEDDGP